MRLISQSELLRATKLEFHALLRRIAADLPPLPEGSHELRIAHNLHNIRVALARARNSGRDTRVYFAERSFLQEPVTGLSVSASASPPGDALVQRRMTR